MKLLHIVSTPREHASNSLRISNAFLEGLHSKYVDLSIEVVDLFNRDLPSIAGDNITVKYHLMSGLKIDKRHEESWKQIELLIENFLAADIYLITAPMWNYGIPYALKYYIDCIVQPGYLFRYNELGQAIGLATGKKMVCVTSRGGDYSEGSPFHAYDFQEPYLRAIFGFCGITDMHFVNAQPMDISLEMRETAVHAAIEAIQELAVNYDWPPIKAPEPVEAPKELNPPTID